MARSPGGSACRTKSREVGQALGRNPIAIIVPCHRVLGADGRMGGFSANGGVATKRRILEIERRGGAWRGPAVRTAEMHGVLGFDPAQAVAHLRAGRSGVWADHRRGRALRHGTQDGAQRVRRTRRGDRLPAALHQGRSHHLRPHVRPLSARPRGLTAERLLALVGRAGSAAPASRAPSCKSLRDLARRTVAGEVPTLAAARRMADAEIVERLIAVHGIGRWSAEMFLMFQLGPARRAAARRLQPAQGLRPALSANGSCPRPKLLERHGEKWRPYRTVASWYLWQTLNKP